jgi:hypothetical protein
MAFAILCIPSISQDSEAVGRPVVVINLSQQEQPVSVAPGDPGTVTFSGEVSAQIPLEVRIQYLIVSLYYTAGNGEGTWMSVGTTQVIFSKGVSTQSFTCSVEVPKGTSHDEPGTLTVSGQWSYSPGSETGEATPDSAAIIIPAYSFPEIEVDQFVAKVEKNEIAEFKFTVRNLGNAPDKYTLKIIAPEGMIILYDAPNPLELNEDEYGYFTVKARSSTQGEKNIIVRVTGSYQGDSNFDNVTVILNVQSKTIVDSAKGYLVPGIAIILLIAAVGVGAFFFVRWKKGSAKRLAS